MRSFSIDPFSRALALGTTKPLTEMSIRNLGGGKKRPARRADNLAAICETNVSKCGGLNLSQTLRASTACTGITLPLPYNIMQPTEGKTNGP
jgi:hypothetical protein